MMFGRLVNAFAILTAFSSASAPLFAKYAFLCPPLTGAMPESFSARET